MADSESDWHAAETYKSLIHFGSFGLRFVLIINGGAALALMTFLGNVVTKSGITLDFRWPMSLFLAGIIVGGFALVAAYLTQLTLYNESTNKRDPARTLNHRVLLTISVILTVIGMLCFLIGAFLAVAKLA